MTGNCGKAACRESGILHSCRHSGAARLFPCSGSSSPNSFDQCTPAPSGLNDLSIVTCMENYSLALLVQSHITSNSPLPWSRLMEAQRVTQAYARSTPSFRQSHAKLMEKRNRNWPHFLLSCTDFDARRSHPSLDLSCA